MFKKFTLGVAVALCALAAPAHAKPGEILYKGFTSSPEKTLQLKAQLEAGQYVVGDEVDLVKFANELHQREKATMAPNEFIKSFLAQNGFGTVGAFQTKTTWAAFVAKIASPEGLIVPLYAAPAPQSPASIQQVAEAVPAANAKPAPPVVAAPAAASYEPKIKQLEAQISALQNRSVETGTPLSAAEKQQLDNLASTLALMKVAQKAAQDAANDAGVSRDAAAGSATAAGAFAQAAGNSAKTAQNYAETAKQGAETFSSKLWLLWVALGLSVLAVLIGIFNAMKKASKKSVAEVQKSVADGVKNRMGIEIPAYLEEHLEALAPGASEEFSFGIEGQAVLVKFTKVDSSALGLKRQSVLTDDIRDQTQPMRIDTLRTKLLGHIGAGRLSSATVKQESGSVLTLRQEAA